MQTVWKGAISFGLVNVPVKLFTATQDNDIPMKMMHKTLNVPIQYTRTCPKCEGDVDWSDIVKGFEYEPGHFVTFDKEELKELASEDTKEIRILDFVELEEIDPIYYQKTYYLAPDQTGSSAYNLLLQALKETSKIGIANITIRSKSSLAAIRPMDDCLAMSTMFYAEEIRPVEQVPNLPKQKKASERELEMAKLLIEQLTSSFEPDNYEDEYKERLQAAIDAKVEGREVKAAPEEKKTNVIDLMDALQASLEQVRGKAGNDKPAAGRGRGAAYSAAKRSKSADAPAKRKKTGTNAKRTGA
ncbi:non-homologous end joining protein Ku [Paenibacillus sp. J31TS4]|uniref:non-homologous end joining protein Ku n=1 Tax=Paenibacillus sp. J31TS4 TaxID=2807195 RepID=UPI001B135DB3|nr:Ku protein [Paenibacillus sp. J31TS4]GIP37653.1 non-homologous end joining protein Ku [Paenibacillus sp. J31TS4]